MSDSLQHHELQHASLPCPLPSKKLHTFKRQTKDKNPAMLKKQINKNPCFIISRHFWELFLGQLQNPFKLPINSGIHISSEQRFIRILYDKLGNVRHSHDRTKAFFYISVAGWQGDSVPCTYTEPKMREALLSIAGPP